MRSFLRLTMFVAMTLISSLNCFPATVYEVAMTTMTSTVDEEEENGDRGHRVPGKRVYCEISQDGIVLPSMDEEEIILFGIYDENGNCLASFNDEQGFLDFLFLGDVNGCVEIRFQTDCKTLRGYLELE